MLLLSRLKYSPPSAHEGEAQSVPAKTHPLQLPLVVHVVDLNATILASNCYVIHASLGEVITCKWWPGLDKLGLFIKPNYIISLI